ncbi:MAG: hypothetical protein CEN90_414 [Parcubacteria group bacterium Licking1014_17]|nr:MAG: hypothetical protein CEN90_414 [Parcubacteria group bacterium Licking1014_17]
MILLKLHFNKCEGGPEVRTQQIKFDFESSDLEKHVANAVLKNIGDRSLQPFCFGDEKLFLTCISDQKNEIRFFNAHNL